VIKIENLSKRYGNVIATDIPSLQIDEGEIIGLVGNNGAGKTTLFSLIMDLIKADSGQIWSDGIDVSHSEEWKKHTGAYISEGFLIDFLTPEEYFLFIANLHGWNKADLFDFLNSFETLFNDEILSQKKYIRDLSKGNQKKVGIVGALIGSPKVIILDEPFANLDPTSQSRLKKVIEELQSDEVTMLISSHDLSHVAEVSTRIFVMETGCIVKDLPKSDDALISLKEYFEV